MQLCKIIYYSQAALHVSIDIFAHHQEHLNCITASGITHACRCLPAATCVCNTRSCNTVQVLLMMSENIARNMQSSQRIINYLTQLHLVGHFCILCHDARKHDYQVQPFYTECFQFTVMFFYMLHKRSSLNHLKNNYKCFIQKYLIYSLMMNLKSSKHAGV